MDVHINPPRKDLLNPNKTYKLRLGALQTARETREWARFLLTLLSPSTIHAIATYPKLLPSIRRISTAAFIFIMGQKMMNKIPWMPNVNEHQRHQNVVAMKR